MELRLEKINKSFGAHHVLKDLSFSAKSGTAVGLLGRNGSGKTTTIRIIMDLFPADSGAATIDGRPSKEFIQRIGYLPEERGLYPKRVISEQMAYIGELRGMKPQAAKDRALSLLTKLGAEEYYKRKLNTLSKGNQQKIQLAISLINDPEIVILDEPFSGLDPVNAKVLKDLVTEVSREGRMVFFSSHQMGYVEEFCDEIIIINEGRIVCDGNLNAIKRTYPRNRVFVVPDGNDSDGLAAWLKTEPSLRGEVVDVNKAHNGVIIKLRDESAKNNIFARLAAASKGIDSFRVVEPTLEEIFIEKAGPMAADEYDEPSGEQTDTRRSRGLFTRGADKGGKRQ